MLNKTGTASGTVEVAPRSQLTKTVTIKNIAGDGNLGITISAGSATNLSGPSLAAGPSPVFRADNTGPVINVTYPVSTPEITRNAKIIKLAGTASDLSGLDKIACGTTAGLTDCTGTAAWTSSVVTIGDGTTMLPSKQPIN